MHAGQDDVARGVRPRRGPQVQCGLAVEDPGELLARDHAHLAGRQTGLARAADGQDRGEQRRAIGHVACEQDLSRRDEAEQREVVGHAPPRGVEEEVRVVRCVAPDPCEVAHPVMGQDQAKARVTRSYVERVATERGDPAPRVGDDRQGALVGEREDPFEPLVVEPELLSPRVELDPARAPR